MLIAKSIDDKPGPDDGYRLLLTHQWPSKFPASAADGFNAELAPPLESYQAFKEGKISYEEFARLYAEALEPKLERLKRLNKQAKDFTITLVSYPDEQGHKIAQAVVDRCQKLEMDEPPKPKIQAPGDPKA